MATLALGLPMPPHESLPDRFLPGVALAERHGRLAQGPAQRHRAGLGDVAALGASGRLLHVGREAGPELQGVGVGETIEGADLGGDDRRPDLADARHAHQQRNDRAQPLAPRGKDHLAAQPFPVTFGEHDDVDEVGEASAAAPAPSRSRFANSQRWAAAPSNLGPRMLAALSMLFMECLVRESKRLKCRQCRPSLRSCISSSSAMNPSGHSPRDSRTAMSSESLRSVFRRLPRRLANSVASAMSIRSTHGRNRSMNHSTNGQASTAIHTGPRQRQQPLFDLAHALGADLEPRDLAGRIDGGERDGALVQVDSDERLKRVAT